MNRNNKKKVLLIEAAVIALIVLVLTVAVVVDTINNKASVTLNNQQAQEIIQQSFEKLPEPLAKTANKVISGTKIDIESVTDGAEKEIIVSVSYETRDVLAVYKKNKNELFSSAYDYYNELKSAGQMTSSLKMRQQFDAETATYWDDAKKKSGKTKISIYEINAETAKGDFFAIPYENTYLRVYLSDDMINTLFGGILSVNKDIEQTKEFEYKGETVSVSSQNTLRNGLSSCFALRNFSSNKPDTSAFFASRWNSFCDEFYRNFIKDAQWKYLANGLATTLEITFFAAILGVILGFVCAIVRVTNEKTGKLIIPDQIVRLYLSVVRGTPVMVQLIIIFFVFLLPMGVEKFTAAVICFAINSGAYVAEIVRGGIASVDEGQTEAGRSLGFNYMQTMYHIVIPQAFKASLPSLANEFITLLKESSVAFYIGVADLTQGGLKIRSITYSNFMPLIAVAVIYLVVVLVLTWLVGKLERRLRRSER